MFGACNLPAVAPAAALDLLAAEAAGRRLSPSVLVSFVRALR
jgi:hypothetical protein